MRSNAAAMRLVLGMLMLLSWLSGLVQGLIPPNGVCDLNILLPFTVRLDPTGESPPMSTGLFTRSKIYSVGYSHLASAVMAMRHFNDRNGIITPEVAELGDCNIHFGMNQTSILDTGTIGNLGNSLIVQVHKQRKYPVCAIAGPYNDNPARNIATMAAAAQVPHVPHRSYSMALLMHDLAPMTTATTPDQMQLAQALVSYLLHIGRGNYIAFFHALSDTGTQAALTQGVAFQLYGIEQYEKYEYISPFFEVTDVDRGIPSQLKKVKERGFRTIVVAQEMFVVDLPALANAAEELGMLNGDYVWIFLPLFEKAAIHNAIQLQDVMSATQGATSFANVTKLLRGAVLLSDIEGYQYLGDADPFLRFWKEQGAEMVEQINEMYSDRTIQLGQKDFLMGPSYFQRFDPEEGTSKMYDTIMAIGLGACKAEMEDSGVINGTEHRDAIRSLKFTGASGTIQFGDPLNSSKEQIRRPETSVFGVYNLYPPSIYAPKPDTGRDSSFDEAFVLTEVLTGLEGPHALTTGKWMQYGPMFVYANGRVKPPVLLRDVPAQNYLSKNLRIVGLTVMGATLLACAISLVFVAVNWSHRVIRASQPMFLCLLLFGAAVASVAIITISFDESYGWDEEALSKACVATPWLFCCGHIITYGALFSKLWRVNKVLQFARRKISTTAVAGPMVLLIFATVVLLTAWTLHDPLAWTRTIVDDFTGESIGQCDSDSMKIYVPLLGVVMAIPTVLTCVMAWKTRDVDETFTESSWIFTLIILQLQVIMVSIPIVVILRGSSADGRYMGLVLLIASFPASTVAFIMCPKFVAYFRKSGSSVTSRPSRSRGASQGGVRVSGISGLSGASSEARHRPSDMGSAPVDRDGYAKKVSFAE